MILLILLSIFFTPYSYSASEPTSPTNSNNLDTFFKITTPPMPIEEIIGRYIIQQDWRNELAIEQKETVYTEIELHRSTCIPRNLDVLRKIRMLQEKNRTLSIKISESDKTSAAFQKMGEELLGKELFREIIESYGYTTLPSKKQYCPERCIISFIPSDHRLPIFQSLTYK